MEEAIPTRKRHRVFEIDDGGSFDRLVEETRRIVSSESEATDLLQCRVLEAFVGRLQKDSFAAKSKGSSNVVTEEKSEKTDCLGAEAEKKKSGLMLVLKRNRVLGGDSKWESEGNTEKSQGKTGLMTSLKRKRLAGELQGNCENKKAKISSDKKAGKRICWAGEKENAAPPPQVPKELEKRIKEKGGRDIQLVIKKKLTATDLKKNQGRLLIPVKQMRNGTRESILGGEEKEVPVMVMEPCGVDSEMVLVEWNMQTSLNYGLRTSWSQAIERNHEKAKHLAVGQFIQLWSFRVGSRLWFAIDTHVPSSSSDSHSNTRLIH